ncbi:ComEC/Rec2 family competence protein [Aeromonas hydrophila]|uniref:ComEC/Rec2 family competence protein n=1 Tax=Aeromonas hydrophila TaxID=644 RepID=UPI0018903E30|nr:MBL fold metallo-hydrolase [Aeromonas hydrophila]MBF4801316.1 MBL fold metallo-hydrolase [Aeromonas hydrophila]
MPFEIDFHAIGNNTKSGDAITMRFGPDLNNEEDQCVIVIDGGFKDDGEKVARFIMEHYKTKKIDLVISTHPDQDHINGLFYILENMSVEMLWIKKPWEHDGLAELFHDGRVTDNSISERLRDNLNKAFELVSLANRNEIKVVEPFSGEMFSRQGVEIHSIGPTIEFYKELIPDILKLKAAEKIEESVSGVESLVDKVKTLFNAIWGKDNLDESSETSPLNSSSVITLVNYGEKSFLFTGDAGIIALKNAFPLFSEKSKTLNFFQIPHHGSRHNISTSILDSYIGKPVSKGDKIDVLAIASAAKEGGPKHPRQAVLNAFIHRGVTVLKTQGTSICHRHGSPARKNWGPATPLEFAERYEESVD